MLPAEVQFAAAFSRPLLFELKGVPVVRASGKDHLRYLHARLTQDVKSLQNNQGACTLLLSPQGRVEGQCLLLKSAESVRLIIDAGEPSDVDNFIDALLRFKVADRIDLVNSSNTILSVQGCGSLDVLKQLGLSGISKEGLCHSEQSLTGINFTVIANTRGTTEGFDLLFQGQDDVGSLKHELANCGVQMGTGEALELLRVHACIPKSGIELTEKTFAGEIDLTEKVSTSKGCYTGQEAVEMLQARGRPNRLLSLFISTGDRAIERGTSIDVLSAEGSLRSGFATSSVGMPSRGCVLTMGFVKAEHLDARTFSAAGQELKICPPYPIFPAVK